jgi:hypothetical protein
VIGRRGRVEFLRRAAIESGRPRTADVLTERDLDDLPDPVARYIRRSGAVGRRQVANFHARIHGRIRSGADSSWMPFRGEQFNTYGAEPSRLFFIVARMKGVPIEVFHSFIGTEATIRGKAVSLVTVVDQRGPDLARTETVTILNDACVMAPAALVGPAFAWEAIDDRTARVVFTRLDETVSATLYFDGADQLIDFVSDDRRRGTTLQRWSTPLGRYRTFGDRWVMSFGEGRWHAPPPEGEFTYVEIELDEITYDVEPAAFRR